MAKLNALMLYFSIFSLSTLNKCFFFLSGRSRSNNLELAERRHQDLGVDRRQAGDSHQHRLLLSTTLRRAHRGTIHY